MDRRPKKHRLSDVNRNNVNMNKCITKVVDAPTEYSILSAEGTVRVMDYLIRMVQFFVNNRLLKSSGRIAEVLGIG